MFGSTVGFSGSADRMALTLENRAMQRHTVTLKVGFRVTQGHRMRLYRNIKVKVQGVAYGNVCVSSVMYCLAVKAMG